MGRNLESVERNLALYLDKFGDSVEMDQFRRVYLNLVLMFKDELEASQLKGALELEKCLSGAQYDKSILDSVEKSCLESMNKDLRNNTSMTRISLLNRLLFGALREAEETDFFYVTDPIFLFSVNMNVTVPDLEEILASQFPEISKVH